jgi:hypothetical protein
VDRAGAWAAEGRIAEEVSKQTDELGISASEPEVTVGGFPFLTQVVDGRYEVITIVLRGVSADGLTVPTLDIRATGVNAQMGTLMSGDGQITADRVDGTATIGYDSVRALIDEPEVELTERDGALRVSLPLTVAGQRFTAVGVADVAVDDGVVRLDVSDLSIEDGTLPPQAEQLLADAAAAVEIELKLPPLPFGLRIEGAEVRPEGVAVTASARGVPLSS